MSPRTRFLTGMTAVLVAAGGVSSVRGDSPVPPFSYKKPSPNGLYVFVMIAPVPLDSDAKRWIEEKAAEISEIRRVYSRSGLYRNDGSTEPLWTIDWYAHYIEVGSDGIHLIRMGPWASSTDTEALSFFANGELMRTYEVRDLVSTSLLLPHSVSHFQWLDESNVDEGRQEFTVRTLDGNRFVFDMRTGQIVSESRPGRNAVFFLSAVLILAVSGVGIWHKIRSRKTLETRSERLDESR
jgi:hypothetical protein